MKEIHNCVRTMATLSSEPWARMTVELTHMLAWMYPGMCVLVDLGCGPFQKELAHWNYMEQILADELAKAAAAHLRAMHERMDAVSEGGDMDRMRLQLLRFALAALTKVLEMTSQDPALRFPSVCHHLVLGAANMMRILANLEGGPDRAERMLITMIAESWRGVNDSFFDIIMRAEDLDVSCFLGSTSDALSAFCDRSLTADRASGSPAGLPLVEKDYFVQWETLVKALWDACLVRSDFTCSGGSHWNETGSYHPLTDPMRLAIYWTASLEVWSSYPPGDPSPFGSRCFPIPRGMHIVFVVRKFLLTLCLDKSTAYKSIEVTFGGPVMKIVRGVKA